MNNTKLTSDITGIVVLAFMLIVGNIWLLPAYLQLADTNIATIITIELVLILGLIYYIISYRHHKTTDKIPVKADGGIIVIIGLFGIIMLIIAIYLGAMTSLANKALGTVLLCLSLSAITTGLISWFNSKFSQANSE